MWKQFYKQDSDQRCYVKVMRKEIQVEAEQWRGVLPNVEPYLYKESEKYKACDLCGLVNSYHGLLKTVQTEIRLCPGDWIITDTYGEEYICKTYMFRYLYKPVLND
jgi:hypothetical protein